MERRNHLEAISASLEVDSSGKAGKTFSLIFKIMARWSAQSMKKGLSVVRLSDSVFSLSPFNLFRFQ